MSEYNTSGYFIDTSTFQVVQDMVPKNIMHQIRYSNYTPVNGVLVPFSISEEMGGQKTREIQIDRISFNGGLPDSMFAL